MAKAKSGAKKAKPVAVKSQKAPKVGLLSGASKKLAKGSAKLVKTPWPPSPGCEVQALQVGDGQVGAEAGEGWREGSSAKLGAAKGTPEPRPSTRWTGPLEKSLKAQRGSHPARIVGKAPPSGLRD